MLRIRQAHLAISVTLLVGYRFAPIEWANLIYQAGSISAVVAILVGIRIHRPANRTPWLLLALAFGLYVIGDLVYTMELWGEPPPFPSFADVPYLLFYPVLFLSIARFLQLRSHRDRSAWIDATIWTLGAGMLAWEPLIEGYALDNEAELAARLIALAYPLLDLGLLLMVLRMIAGQLRLSRSFLLLASAILMQTVTDVVYAAEVLDGTYVGGFIDLGWLATYVLIGAAALHPSMVTLTEQPVRLETVASRWRIASLGAAGITAPALLLHQVAKGDLSGQVQDVLIVSFAVIVIMTLAVARGHGLIAVAERHVAHVSARQVQLEQVMLDRERLIDRLNRKVSHDTLTGLASRDRFVDALEAALAARATPSVAFLDLDDFKSINDTLGHDAGDRLLRDVASRLNRAVRSEDLVARFGGDEFAVLFTGDVEACAARLLDAFHEAVVLEGRELRLSVSIGVTTAKPSSVAGDLLREADVAMYTAKRSGTGWAQYQTGMSATLLERMDLRARLVAALRAGEVLPWFQPVVDLETGRLVGFEALARWCPADAPVRDPGTWLPLAEETGLIVEVDRAVFRAAVAQLVAWRSARAVDDLTLAVNLSARTLQIRGIAEEMVDVLVDLGLPPDRLTIEVTEGVLIDDELVSARLQVLRAAGIKVALDDFGTGWSSLSYLRRFPVDQLKLDRTFTAELGTAVGGDAIPAAVLQLARALHIDVVAEGVETSEQRGFLLDLGFHTAQGYLFGRALPAHLLDPLLELTAPSAPVGTVRLRAVDPAGELAVLPVGVAAPAAAWPTERTA